MDQNCLSSTFHRCAIGLQYAGYGGQVNTLNSLSCSSNYSLFALWLDTLTSEKNLSDRSADTQHYNQQAAMHCAF